jgi:preprotein translocase subunit SecD
VKSTRRYKFNLVLALVVAFGGLAAVMASGTSPNLGLDLSGGTSVILTASAEGGVDEEVLQKTVEIIRRRIDALGVAEPEVSAAGGENILIQLPGVKDEERALEIIGSTAQLTFRQVLEIVPRDGAEATPTPGASPTAADTPGSDATPDVTPTEDADTQQRSATQATDDKKKKKKDGGDGKASAEDGEHEDDVPHDEEDQEPAEVTEEKGPQVNDEEVVYPDAADPTILYRLAPAGVLTGDIIARAEAVVDQAGNWAVTIDMNDRGAKAWADLTSELACLRDEGEPIRSQVAIVLDGKVETATGMRDPAGAAAGGGVECGRGITGGESQIDVGTEQEAKDLALVLQTGALPLTLTQSEVNKVSPTLGRDSLQAGLTAGAIGLGLVLLYVLVYYRALGLVVWAGLAIFTATIYSLLAFLGESSGLSLTLAGIAGIIVSIGITTDSYIVAFERLKDEVRSGKTLRAAVDRGMTRAFRTILIADFVTGSAAVILFFLAVGPVRGFALTLGLATLIDVLIAYFFTRSAVGLLSRSRLFAESRVIGVREALGVQT